MHPEPEPPTDRKAPIALWRFARRFFCNLHLAWGNPCDVAAMPFLSRKIRDLFASWIRVGEAVMRRMLLIEAALLDVPPPSRRQPAGKMPAVRKRKLIEFHADKPEDWRVSFNCISQAERRLPAGTSRTRIAENQPQSRLEDGAPTTGYFSAWPLALRYEALFRAFNDPQPYARRLARRLHAHPHLIEPLLEAPPEYEHRLDHADDLTQAARNAWPQRQDSS